MSLTVDNPGLPTFNTTGKSFLISNGWVNQIPASSGSAIPGGNSANKVFLVGFELTQPITIKTILTYITTTSAGNHAGFGIYDVNGNLIIDSGPMLTTGSGAISTTLGTAVSLQPGFYWFAYTADSLTPAVVAMTVSTSNSSTITLLNANGSSIQGSATTASVAGQLPSTTGGYSIVNTVLVLPFVIFRS